MKTPLLWLASLLVLGMPASAQTPVSAIPSAIANAAAPARAVPTETGETTVTLDIGFGVRAVPPARVSVPVGEKLTIVAPAMGAGSRYLWTRDGKVVPGAPATNILILPRVGSSDAGRYVCQTAGPDEAFHSQELHLGVGQTSRLLNVSTRVTIPAGAPGFVSGFVVEGAHAKRLILRAVGPTLARFGVEDALRSPALRVFDQHGKDYAVNYSYPATGITPQPVHPADAPTPAPAPETLTYETDLARSLARAGAFPLPADGGDAVLMMPFPPGSYTAQITARHGSGGVVLFEIYEVP